jgi:hypothetical protein
VLQRAIALVTSKKARRYEVLQYYQLKRWNFDKGLKAFKKGHIPGKRGRPPLLRKHQLEDIISTIKINSAFHRATHKKEIRKMV